MQAETLPPLTEPRASDDGLPTTVRQAKHPRHVAPLVLAEDVMHYAVAVLLVAIALAVLWRTVSDLVVGHRAFWDAITNAINDVLFVVIVLEIFRTILAHFHEGGFQLKPFLIIGVISAVRHVLTVGAQLSIQGEGTNEHFRRSLMELGVNAAVVLALVVALVMVKRAEKADGSVD